MSAALTLQQYANTLRRMYTVIRGWELWASQHAPEQYRDLLQQRQRSQLIKADLDALEQEPVAEGSSSIEQRLTQHFLGGNASHPTSPADFLGAMYVVEGSTLGGQYIAKHVGEKFILSDGCGNAYFRGYGDRTGSMWRSFKQELAALPEEDGDRVIAAARVMFRVFGEATAAPETDSRGSATLVLEE